MGKNKPLEPSGLSLQILEQMILDLLILSRVCRALVVTVTLTDVHPSSMTPFVRHMTQTIVQNDAISPTLVPVRLHKHKKPSGNYIRLVFNSDVTQAGSNKLSHRRVVRLTSPTINTRQM